MHQPRRAAWRRAAALSLVLLGPSGSPAVSGDTPPPALARVSELASAGPSVVFVNGTRLMVQKRLPDGALAPPSPFTIRGVNWSPASRDTTTTPTDRANATVRRREFGLWYATDIPLMRAMHVNTVRLAIDPGFDATLGPVGLRVLDELYRNDIMVVMTVDDAINDLERVRGAVTFYRDHPAILMWSLGSEWNISRYFRGWSIQQSAQQTEVAARLVKTLDTAHPVASSYGEIDIDAPGLRLADTSAYVNTVVPTPDLWSINLYRGSSFDDPANVSAFQQWGSLTSKPVFVGEFGIDAFHGRCLTNPPSGTVNGAEQVRWNLDLWNDIARNLSAASPANVVIGGTAFEWNDEWWKVPPPGSQQTGGWTSDGFPDWHGTEEYFGLVDIDRNPRPVHAALAAAFDPGYRPPPHVVTFRAISRGGNICGAQADFRRDGHTFYQRFGFGSGGRGFNVAIADPASGAILDAGRNFDTWAGGAAAKQALLDHLTAIPSGRLVMLAVADEAGITFANDRQCTPVTDATTLALVQRLQSLGSTRIDEYCWRGSWAMVAVTGTGVALAEDYDRIEEARVEPALAVPDSADPDGDGLPTAWELQFGLDPSSAEGLQGADGDPDGDGMTNAQEAAAVTHPRGLFRRFLAEGAVNEFFDVRLALLNVGPLPAHVQLRFLQPDGMVVTRIEKLPPGRRRTLGRAELQALRSPDFSTVLEADQRVVLDRTMSWGGGYGSHAETALVSPSTTWYLAEGATGIDFQLFYLLQNPNSTPVTATVRYLLPDGQPPIQRPYALPPNSRTTIHVNNEDPGLAATDVSAEVTGTQPIIVERAMYLNRPGQPFAAGHGSAGVTAPALEWFLAEGATGPFFDLFVLIANPNPTPAEVTADYLLLGGGVHTKGYTIPANGRFTIYVDREEIPVGSGQRPLVAQSLSTVVRATNGVPVIVERAMWWPGPEVSANVWYEAHNSPGATTTGTKWALAEGEVGGSAGMQTFVLLANTSATAGSARVTLHFEDGTTAERSYTLPANSRTNVAVASDFPEAVNRRFGAIIESLGATPAPIVVERAMYFGEGWTAGTSALATKLEP
jgi:hypothetical protein